MEMARPSTRPRVTLAYAQSLDGSVAARSGTRLLISGRESLEVTHQLRAHHDAILVGIGTVLADNPQLSVRFAQGPDPRPVVLDTRLRCPPGARLFEGRRHPLLMAGLGASSEREAELVAAGAEVCRLPECEGQGGPRLDLEAVLMHLSLKGINTVMVEGGVQVLSSFLCGRLVDRMAVTIAPMLVGGVHGVQELLSETGRFPRLRDTQLQRMGEDWVVLGEVEWGEP